MAIRFLILLILSTQIAFSFEIPADLLSPQKITNELRLNLVNKIAQMKQNFIQRNFESGIYFTSNERVICPLNTTVERNQSLFKIVSKNEDNSDENDQKISSDKRFYYGCAGKLSFFESLTFEGKEHISTKKEDVFEGKINLKLNQNFNKMTYKMEDGFGSEILRINTVKSDNSFTSTIFLNNQKFIIIKGSKNKVEKYLYHFFPLNFSLNRNGYSATNQSSERFMGYMYFIKNSDNQLTYFDSRHNQISFVDFQKKFIINGLDFIMDSVLIELPRTKFASLGNQNARLLDELRNAQAWVTSGQANLVRNYLESLIKSIKEGYITDTRPKN